MEVAVGAERNRGERAAEAMGAKRKCRETGVLPWPNGNVGEQAAEAMGAKRKCRETGVLPWPSGTLWPIRQLLIKDEKEIKISVYNGNTYVGDAYVDDAYVANTL